MTKKEHQEHEFSRGFGWKPQYPDIRDRSLSISLQPASELPPNYDMRGIGLPEVYDQGQQGSCTANAGAFLEQLNLLQTGYPWPHMPSRSFLYYNTRLIEGTQDQDSGATIRDTIKAMAKYGICPEKWNPDWDMPYDDKVFDQAPREQSYKDALLHSTLTYESVPQQSDIIKALLVQHIPVIIGFTVHNSFMTKKVANTGIMPKPGFLDGRAGGHAVAVVGYITDNEMGNQGIKDWAIVRNSWGSDWGQDGYFLMPWNEVLLNPKQASDFWCIHTVGYKKAG